MVPENLTHYNHETEHQHLHELRRTFDDIRSRQDIGSQATMEMAYGNKGHRTKLRRHAMGRAAREYASLLEPDDPRHMYASIIGVVPDYLEAEHALPEKGHRSFGKKWLTEAQWDTAKKNTIIFNDTMRDIVTTHPHIQQQELIDLVVAATDAYNYNEENKQLIHEKTEQVLYGMRHEVAFNALLAQLPEGFEVITTTVTDDEHGADFKVRCPNGVVVSIDVKASMHAVEKSIVRQSEYEYKYHTKVPANEIILWSGFDDTDFTPESPWLPTQEAIERVMPHIIAELTNASEKYSHHSDHHERAGRHHKQIA